jgi:3-dehydroquinate synthase
MTVHYKKSVSLDTRSYDIVIGEDILDAVDSYIPFSLSERLCFILTDETVEKAGYAETLKEAIKATGATDIHIMSVPAGESSKSFDKFQEVLEWMLDRKVNRQSVLFALGGGVVGDLGGYAAASILRGISFIQVPTTLLAQVDSSVGGKTGINTLYGKNLVGAFYQPQAVVCDLKLLASLPERQLKAGYAEVVKYGLIQNEEFFEWLDEHSESLLSGDLKSMAHAVNVSCAEKAAIVSADEKEGGIRALLNLGHTFGHAFEASAGYDGSLLHGEAIAVGMVIAFQLSHKMDLCTEANVQRVVSHFKSCGLPTCLKDISGAINHDAQWLLQTMAHDKKVYKGQLTFILTRGIGQSFVCRDVQDSDVLAVLEESTQGNT